MKARSGNATVIRGGRLLDVRGHRADPADLLIVGDTIREIGAPGLKAPAGAAVINARGKLLHAGLINAHTHGHGNLAKGMGERWTLELLLTAGSWITGGRAYADVGMRAVVAPMVADRTFYEAIPGLMDVLTPGLRNDVAKLRLGPWKTSVANMRRAFRGWTLDRDQ